MKKLIIALVLTLALGAVFVAAAPHAFADAKSSVCDGIALTGGAGGCAEDAGAGPTVASIIGTAINILSIIVGVAAVIMIIVGGLRYVLSGGDSNSIGTAKNTILYAVIGLVIALLAQGIVRFVISRI